MQPMKAFNKDFCELTKNTNAEMIICTTSADTISFSYAEVMRIVKRIGYYYEQIGLKEGDTIATILPNSVEAICCFLAAAYYGINYAPLPCTVSERECHNWNDLTKPSFYIVKKGIVEFDIDIEGVQIETDSEFEWLSDDCREELAPVKSAKVFLLTSGTTGDPKAMQIDVNKLWNAGRAFAAEYGILDSGMRFWNYLPMSYLGGLFNLAIIPVCCNGSFVISEPFSGKTMLNFWNYVKQYQITALWFVPSIVRGLLKIHSMIGNKYDELFKSIRIAFLGTAPIDLKTKENFESAFGIRLYENFALSETTFLTGEFENNIRYREECSVGSFLKYVEYRLDAIDGVDDVFEICVKTPFLFDGYLDKAGNLVLEIDDSGFFNTKDLGHFNDDGQLVLSGRSRDIIKKSGLFVSLTEVETVVVGVDYVDEATAVPITHEFYGEAYILFVIFKNQKDVEAQKEKLRGWMMTNFVPYKLPERIVACSDFPRTASGKIKKRDLLSNYERANNVSV